jgi:SAM-dependent methyltransferase
MDAVIAESAKLRGIEVTPPDFTLAFERLAGRRFDCVLLVHVLQYVRDPAGLLARCADLINDTGRLVIVVPNFNFIRYRLDRSLRGQPGGKGSQARSIAFGVPNVDAFERIGIHRTTARRRRQWVSGSRLALTRVQYVDVCRMGRLIGRVAGVGGSYVSRELMAIAGRA